MSGEIDYLLRVVVANVGAYETFYGNLIANVTTTDVSASLAMEEMKYITVSPLHGIIC